MAYVALLLVLSPLLIHRMIRHGKYRTGWGQKLLGSVPELPPAVDKRSPRFWFHAVSVGEVLLLRSVIDELVAVEPAAEIVISTTTHTGHAVAVEKYPEATVCYFPLDFTWAVSRAIDRIRPTRIVIAELELWPNFLLTAARRGIPVTLINGRLSEKSFRGYSRIRWLMRTLLQTFDTIASQNELSAQRFCQLGAAPDRVIVTGSVKFDRVVTDRGNPATLELRSLFGLRPHEQVFVAGSTQAPEERLAIEAWQVARLRHPGLRLVLVPRHRERFEDVARLVESCKLPLVRRSSLVSAPVATTVATTVAEPDNMAFRGNIAAVSFAPQAAPAGSEVAPPVLLLDTLGELSACWGLADVAFVGGSLGSRGGQNMIEPAGYGAAVCFGPNTRNFRHVVESLLVIDAARVVTPDTLTDTLLEWLDSPNSAKSSGERARDFVVSQRGASQRTVMLLIDRPHPEVLMPACRAA